jgi:hypothetical protein
VVSAARVGQRDFGGGDVASLHVGDRGRTVAVEVELNEACRTEGWVFVFRWDGMTIRRVGKAYGDEGAKVGDLNGDGRLEFEVWNDKGYGCHAAQNRWPDLYAIRGGRFVMAGSSCPNIYRKARNDVLWHLQTMPCDPVEWRLYGRALKYAGIKESPRHAYRHVIRLAKQFLNAPNDDRYTWCIEESIPYLEERARKNTPFAKFRRPAFTDNP